MTVDTPDRTRPGRAVRSRRRQCPSPWEGERVRALSRLQVEDRALQLGDLYMETAGAEPWAWDQSRRAFLRRLAADLRRPGFALVVAETTVLTGCAYGFPVRGDGPWWRGLDGHLPRSVLRVAAAGRLFAVSEILVPPRVRAEDQDREWNLARRLQRRLLADRAATLGVTLVDRGDTGSLSALRSWGWRCVETGADGVPLITSCQVLVLAP